ncbi:metallophosphoesterase [Botrimarina colliarenosi]|nr:metallophosphoesterase [Botrimarina colliarenosi]
MKKFACLSLCLFASSAAAHEGHEHADEAAAPGAQFPAAIALPAIDGPKPWSDKPLLNDPDRFQIAIVTDRTGGHRPGIWMDAVRKLNLLRPEFVVSVGDLIEGYTEDLSQIEREWGEFLGFIDQMQMRFFFVAGNHDVTNPVLHKKWREQFGREWYSFDYRGVHFLCLCSEDPVQQHISDEQIEFVRDDLEKHADARWTLVFLHKPLWTYAERAEANGDSDPTNWRRVEKLLVDRPHTIFAGHVHHYVQYQRNGRDYYSLGTTGGGSQLRGNEYGEFDHVTWLTMEADGPQVVNLRLDGILPAGIVTESSAARFSDFLRKVRVEVAPILVDDHNAFSEGGLSVRLSNEFGELVEMSGRVDGLPLRGLTVEPDGLKLSVGPVGEAEQHVRIRFEEPIQFETLRRATFTATLRTKPEDGSAPLSAERVIPVVIDRRHVCPLLAESAEIDGVIEPWPELSYATPDDPVLMGAVQDWTGPADASFKVAAGHDGASLVLMARVTDEQIVPGKDRLQWILDARPAAQRRDEPTLQWGALRVAVGAPDESGDAKVTAFRGRGRRREAIEGVEGAARRTETGYDVELSIPAKELARFQGGQRWETFQLAAVQTDADDSTREPTEVVWRGTSDVRFRNSNFAQFVRED